MMNKGSLVKALNSAAWIALPLSLISLLFCTVMIGSGILEMLLPVLLAVIFAIISFALAHIPFAASRLWIKIVICAAVVAVTVICLRIF
jgi:hypothetical protein